MIVPEQILSQISLHPDDFPPPLKILQRPVNGKPFLAPFKF